MATAIASSKLLLAAVKLIAVFFGYDIRSLSPRANDATHIKMNSKLVTMLAELTHLQLPSDPVLGATTINIGALSGGVADNVIAPSAEARLMARLVTPAEEVIQILQRWANGRAILEQGITVPPVRLKPVDGFPTSVAAFATDLPSLTNWGTPYLFGPGSVHVAHTDHEFVHVSELDQAVDAYVRLATAAIAALPA
jgi:acetylornithine deacetylase